MAEVICIGGANWDIKARTLAEPVAETSNPGQVRRSPGGVARNVAANLARLGLAPALVTAVGADEDGRELVALTRSGGVDVLAHVSPAEATGCYVSLHHPNGELLIAVNAMDVVAELTAEVLADHERRIAAAYYVFADCNLPVDSLRWLKAKAERLIIDAVSVPKARKLVEIGLDGLHMVTSNRAQADVMADAPGKAEVTVVTQGADGVTVSGSRVPPCAATRIVDVTGAGDAATAGLVFGLVRGMKAVEAARLGQAAAAITTEDEQSVSPRLTVEALYSRAGAAITSR